MSTENTGQTGDDLPVGQIRVRNETGNAITYQFKWGTDWRSITLSSGMMETHSYSYGENGAAPPTPEIRYDFVWKNGTPIVVVDPPPPGWPTSSMQTFTLAYNTVGMAGGEPKDYSFRFSETGLGYTRLDLVAGA